AVLAALLLMHPAEFRELPKRTEAPQRMVREFTEGIRFVFRSREAVAIVIVLGIIGCFGYNFTVIMPLLAQNVYHAGANGFGVLMSAIGLGSLVAAVSIATLGEMRHRNLLIAGGAFSLLLLLTAIAPWFGLAIGVLVLLGFAGQYFTSSANTLLQFLAPDYLRGRVMSVYMLLFAGTTPIGALVTGYMAGTFGVRSALGIEAVLCVAAAAAGALYWRLMAPPNQRGKPLARLAPWPLAPKRSVLNL
ncbi:MAG: MFS transporter, partial [Chloroflexota bacterium]